MQVSSGSIIIRGEHTGEAEEGEHSERVDTEEGKVARDAHC